MLVAITLSYPAYDAITLGHAPPSIEVGVGLSERLSHNFMIPVTFINHGDQTAEGVHIEVTLENGGEEYERAQYVVALLPRHATREGWVAFQTDPRAAQRIRARVLGYEKP